MPINNALTPEGLNALGAAFGFYPQLRRNRTVQDPRAALDMPVQALRGRVAATAGMPSDILNMVRTPMPMEMYGDVDYGPQTQVPYGSQELLKTLPLPPQGPAQQAAANLGALAPMTPAEALQAARLARQAALAGGQAAMKAGMAGERYAERVVPGIMERGGMPAQMLGAMANRTMSPMDVYHGSPHRLAPTPVNPLGEFDASKIGSGAGAQRYGYGIYTSEAPQFADMFAVRTKTPDVQGIASQNGLQLSRDAQVELLRQSTRDSTGKPTKGDNYIDPIAAARKLQNASIEARQMPAEKLQNTIREVQEQNKAYLYKADLPDEKIARMLDFDKHLSEQSLEIQKILLPYQKEIGTSFGTGGQVLKEIAFDRRMKGLDDSPAAVAQQLRNMGIPGVTYKDLDTRNFVTFPGEEKSMKILERKAR
jgi:hypothetical protein